MYEIQTPCFAEKLFKKMDGKVRKSKGKLGKHGKERTVITNACKARGLDRQIRENKEK